MNRADAMQYISFGVDDAGHGYNVNDARRAAPYARLVGWQCGFEPLFVAVWSYLPDVRLDDDEAEELARTLLEERCWFGIDAEDSRDADYIL